MPILLDRLFSDETQVSLPRDDPTKVDTHDKRHILDVLRVLTAWFNELEEAYKVAIDPEPESESNLQDPKQVCRDTHAAEGQQDLPVSPLISVDADYSEGSAPETALTVLETKCIKMMGDLEDTSKHCFKPGQATTGVNQFTGGDLQKLASKPCWFNLTSQQNIKAIGASPTWLPQSDSSRHLGGPSRHVRLLNQHQEHDQWIVADHLTVNPAEPSEVEQLARKYPQNRHATFYDKNFQAITPAHCFCAVTEDGSNTIFMAVSREWAASVSQMLNDSRDYDQGLLSLALLVIETFNRET
ncbi:hypothetical protein VTN00DRAFT_5411 [Thermoascus crustaceus]|uniref:uncharacterized protein n=1 Tax=Thermoascus crustaceus TaxID=5088 RepID=UPI003743A1A2